ncbi:LytR/AlgR family response regulator transcription factor, partial [candidate division KSB1 bacterium]
DKKFLSRIMIKEKGKISFVNAEEIKWLEALDYYVRIHTAGSTYLLRESLKQLEKSLDPDEFFRIHRSAIVKFNEIESLHTIPCGDYEVILRDKTKLKLARTRVHLLKEFLK